MSAGLSAQYAIILAAVAASIVYLFLTRFPAQARWLRGRIAIRLVRARSERLRMLARRIAPAPVTAGACGSCNGCGPAA